MKPTMRLSALLLVLLAQNPVVNGATTIVAITSTLVVTLSTTLVIPDAPSAATSGVTSSVASSSTSSISSDSDSTSVSPTSTSTSSSAESGSTIVTDNPVSITATPTTLITVTASRSDSTLSNVTDEPSDPATSIATSSEADASPTTTSVPASGATTEDPTASTSVATSDPASTTTSSAEASSTALEPGLRLQISGGDYDGYYVGNDDPAGGFGVATLYPEPSNGDIFTADVQNRLIASDGTLPNFANQDADVPAQPIYFNSASALASFMDVVYLKCMFSGEFMTCTSGNRNTFVACGPGVYNGDAPTLYLNIPDRVDDGCSAVEIRVVTF